MPKRSEVYFGRLGEEWNNVRFAKAAGQPYYCFGDFPNHNVYKADLSRKKVCKVRDLCQNKDLEDDADPFPPLPPEPETRTLEDRILDAAMRSKHGNA